jgi:mannose-6-phosphate isomerase
VDILTCRVMPYAWGSRSAIATVCGRDPSGEPEAELWMGAHPIAPSTVVRDGQRAALGDVVRAAPERELGGRVVRELGTHFPFLLKLLAAAEPLSLQAHPSRERAAAGFADEERRGIPLDAPHRSYKDASHKPELLCALSPFDALAGFRPPAEILAVLRRLGGPALAEPLAPLAASPDARGLEATFRALMTLPELARFQVVEETLARATGASAEDALVRRLAALHPGDVGVVSALMLQPVRLEPGEAIYLGPGGLHAYLEGTGVEIMASSDNVLRGGLTKKFVDVAELLASLDFAEPAPGVIRPRPLDEHESIYDTPAREFRLSVLTLDGEVVREVDGPEILFVTEGRALAGDGTVLERGASAFVPASTGAYTLDGEGRVFRASTNLAALA